MEFSMNSKIKARGSLMSDMTIKETVPESQGPQLIIEPVPCLSPLVNMVWPTVKPHIEELASQSHGDFTVYDVYKEVFYGSAFLLLGYMVDDKKEKKFIGFVIYKLEKTAAHIWQTFIIPEYRATNVFDLGYRWIESELKKTGAEYISMSIDKGQWHHSMQKLGYSETFTIYRKRIKES